MTTTPLIPKGLNSWNTTSTMVACARLAASTSAPFTASRLSMASGAQSNNSRSRCRPRAFNPVASPFGACAIYRTSLGDTPCVALPLPLTALAQPRRGREKILLSKTFPHSRVRNFRLQENNAAFRPLRRRSRAKFRLHSVDHRLKWAEERDGRDLRGRATTKEARREARMRKKVTMAAATAGHAEGGSCLNAFDNALLAAGIGNLNLIKVSSILPPEVPVIDLPKIKLGALIPTAYAAVTSETPGEIIAAAVGYAVPDDPAKNGVIMEYHGVASRAEAERQIDLMLDEAFRVRGEIIKEKRVVAVEHTTQRIGCAPAAITLLGGEELV